MSAITIRPARPDDAPALVDFNAALAQETEAKSLDRAVLARGVQAVFEDPRRGAYTVAELDGAVVGGLMVTYEWSDWRCGDWWWIQSVYVRPAARGRGVFRTLYAETERRARATPGVVGLRLYVEWENARARRVYESLGMREAHYHLLQAGFLTLD